jgi:diacylglycerol kinase family enzyme
MKAPAPALVLLNPHAAGGRAAALQAALHDWLRARAPQARCEAINGVAAARARLAAQPPGSRIVLVGGDGTVHQMLPTLLQHGHELALVPLGSGNDTARALGLAGLGWRDALAHALQAPALPIDIGCCEVEGRHIPFISSLTAGFDAAVGERAIHGPAWLRGLPRYLRATLVELAGLRLWPMQVTADGQEVHVGPALFASVLNTPTYGSGIPVAPSARIDDGRLDLLLAGAFSRREAATMLPRLLGGRHLGHAQVKTLGLTMLHAVSSQPVPLAADGEPAGRAQAWSVRVQPGALRIACRQPAPTRPEGR